MFSLDLVSWKSTVRVVRMPAGLTLPFMLVRSFRLAIIAATFSLLLFTSAQAQQTGEEPIRVETDLVQLNVGVADPKGYPVTNLSQSDFVIYEDGVKQPITHFEAAQVPFSIVLLLDMSGSTLNFRTSLKQAALRFLDALAPDDRICVVQFNEKVETLQKFTSDRKKIAFAVGRATGHGETQFYGALRYSIGQLSHEARRSKAIIVLTDGLDTEMRNQDRAAVLSATTDQEALSAVKPLTSSALRSVLELAGQQGVTIYPLELPSGDPKKLPISTPQITAIYAAARERLNELANLTGGRIHEIHRLEEIGRLYAEIAAELNTVYSIAYQPSNGRRRNGEWRAISIEVTRPELIARTRPGYFAR